ncbi:HDOD domain-containing protein [Bacterioplanoides sp. SCSIO 12839]|uniref:HDOD domain-containing protein n=1 Tax=Bacterioplanoides sp. SCSIO 12839 TaxID=2829569 RepID=UPI002104E080|nr:HDOD domain-containing protein [Bacterioplanoides sp. SCSIO 12839]UTW47258.1 HDOD domain-containing protein [Bacterioplanoides sp. SCSIO 12839]
MNTDLAKQVKDDIVAQIKNDELVLPTLPEIALKVREVAENPNATIDELCDVISRDPALSARIIKVTNSPLLRTSMPVDDLVAAVSRLGIDFTSNLAIGLAMEQMFQATNDMIDHRMRQCWSQAMEIASTAQVLARHFTRLKPDQAMLAGLVHQIGILPILAYAENNASLLADSLSLDKVIERLHPALGAYILRSWDFPAEIIEVAKHYIDQSYQADEPTYTDLIQVATFQSYADSDHPLAKVDRSQLGSFKRLGLDSDEEVTQLEALSEEVGATQSAISG